MFYRARACPHAALFFVVMLTSAGDRLAEIAIGHASDMRESVDHAQPVETARARPRQVDL